MVLFLSSYIIALWLLYCIVGWNVVIVDSYKPLINEYRYVKDDRILLDNTTTTKTMTGTIITNEDDPPVLPRLIGGTNVQYGVYPWFAFPAGITLCGASLIHVDILLSAGHCEAENAFNDGILIGGINIDGSDGTYYFVEQTLVHPDYPGVGSEPNDLMLIKLRDPVTNIQPVQYSTNNNIPNTGATVTILGMGDTSVGGSFSNVLQSINLTVPAFDDCNNYYGKLVEELMFCSYYPPDFSKDSCQGDSGGPVLNQNNVLVGVVFFGDKCAAQGAYGVNTKVGAYTNWIQSEICNLSDFPPDSCNDETPPTTTTAPVSPPISNNTPISQSPTFAPSKAPSSRAPIPPPTQAPATSAPATKAPATSTPSVTPVTSSPISQPTTLAPVSNVPIMAPTKNPSTGTPKTTSPGTPMPTVNINPVSESTMAPILTTLSPTSITDVMPFTNTPSATGGDSPTQMPIGTITIEPTITATTSSASNNMKSSNHKNVLVRAIIVFSIGVISIL